MFKINCLNKISPIGTDRLGDNYTLVDDTQCADGILVRSGAMHDMDFANNLLAIARAGAGVNNIPLDRCSSEGIVVFNTPGANANAVKEMVLTALFMASRKIIPSIEWTKTLKGMGEQVPKLVEKGKGNFTGPEIMGKSLGVIGLGAIGAMVANSAVSLGMKVYGYDPYLSVTTAWGLSSSIVHAKTLDEIFSNCDYITIHIPLTNDTKHFVNSETIAKMKNKVRILNFARGELVNSADLIKALEDKKVSVYATDFPDDALIDTKGIIAIPHLGASTPESEDNCAVMATEQMKDYLENGNILNSVNMPAISLPRDFNCTRVCLIHKNVPNTIGSLASFCGDNGINIENMLSKSRDNYAYTILDVKGNITPEHISRLNELEPVIKVRVI